MLEIHFVGCTQCTGGCTLCVLITLSHVTTKCQISGPPSIATACCITKIARPHRLLPLRGLTTGVDRGAVAEAVRADAELLEKTAGTQKNPIKDPRTAKEHNTYYILLL